MKFVSNIVNNQLNDNKNKMEATVNGENFESPVDLDEIDDRIARLKADRKRLKSEQKILEKRRRRWSKIDLGLRVGIP